MEKDRICKKCGGISGWDSYFQAWVCTRCGDMVRKPITNYDRIIGSSPEKMAAQLATWFCRLCEHCPIADKCNRNKVVTNVNIWLSWLNQEVDYGRYFH